MLIDGTNTYCVSNIRYLRKRFCVSRRGLARLIGMREYILRDIEKEHCVPVFRKEQISRLCAVFNITVEQLFHCELSGETDLQSLPLGEGGTA